MSYIIRKASRDGGAYDGPSCEDAGIPRGRRYIMRENAEVAAAKLQEVNPVGWEVVEVPDELGPRTGAQMMSKSTSART